MEGLSKKRPGPSIPEKQTDKLEAEAAWCAVGLQSPSILAPGAGFVEDNFSKHSGGGGWQMGSGSGSDASKQ